MQVTSWSERFRSPAILMAVLDGQVLLAGIVGQMEKQEQETGWEREVLR